jgi:hypothetical protein
VKTDHRHRSHRVDPPQRVLLGKTRKNFSAQGLPARLDKKVVSSLRQNADELFEAAQQSAEECRVCILIGQDGAVRILPAAGWRLDSLRVHHGAAEAYRVTRAGGVVRLEARGQAESCLLESNATPSRCLGWSADLPQYQLLNAPDSSFPAVVR